MKVVVQALEKEKKGEELCAVEKAVLRKLREAHVKVVVEVRCLAVDPNYMVKAFVPVDEEVQDIFDRQAIVYTFGEKSRGTTVTFLPFKNDGGLSRVDQAMNEAEKGEALAAKKHNFDGKNKHEIVLCTSRFYDINEFALFLESEGHAATISDDGTSSVDGVPVIPGNWAATVLNALASQCEDDFNAKKG